MPVITMLPRWEEGIEAEPAMRTVVAESLSGVEDRRQRYPRQKWPLQYQALTPTARETAVLRSALLAAREVPVAVPFWPQRAEVVSAPPEGLAITTEDLTGLTLFVAGAYAVVMHHPLDWEVVRISDVGTASIEITEPLAAARSGGSIVPLLFGHLPRPDTSQLTDAAGSWPIDFQEEFLEVETET